MNENNTVTGNAVEAPSSITLSVICDRDLHVINSIHTPGRPNAIAREYMRLQRHVSGRRFAQRLILSRRPDRTSYHFTRAFRSYELPIVAK